MMSVSTATPEPRRGKASSKPAAKKRAAARSEAHRAASASSPVASRRCRALVPPLRAAARRGEHPFSELRQDFGEWCEVGDMEPVSDVTLAAWLRRAGLSSYHSGRAKVTYYAKRAARLAA